MHVERTADSNTLSTDQVSLVQLVTDKYLVIGRSSTALKRSDRSKQRHCLQFAQRASLASCITLKRL